MAAVDQYNTIGAFGGSFETHDARDQPVSSQMIQADPVELWQSLIPDNKFNIGWLPPNYTWNGVNYVPELLIRPVQEIDTLR